MPLLIGGLLSILGIGVVNLTTKANGDSILTPTPQPEQHIGGGSLPSWVIPTVIVGVGGFLAYKYGAKVLKV